jgi:tripartite-type tricarboxylate transporter receptor subunit TctC
VHFSSVVGITMTHIPYKGGAPAIQSVVAGDTQLTFGTPPSVLPMVAAGRLKALGVTSPQRSPLVPDVPGMLEAGVPGYSMNFWYGLFVPAGTPPDVIKRLFDAAQKVMAEPEVKAALAREGTEVALSKSSEDFASFLAEDNRFWAKLAKDAGVKLD